MIKLSIHNIESGLKKKQEEMASLGPTRADPAAYFMEVFQNNYGITI